MFAELQATENAGAGRPSLSPLSAENKQASLVVRLIQERPKSGSSNLLNLHENE